MIAVDTCSWIAYFGGAPGADVDLIERALEDRQVCLPPVVLAELHSDPALPSEIAALLAALPLLEPLDGFWLRAGRLRAKTIADGRKARLADVLIAQSCLDYRAALLTRDDDFAPFAETAGLEVSIVTGQRGGR